MSERDHESKRDDLAAYLLGALDPGKAAALEQHLADCEQCRAELEWLRPAALMLPETVERVEPPLELRARIMDEVETDAAAKRSRAGTGWTMRSQLLRPAVGLAVLALLVAAIAGYAIRDSGSGGSATTTVVAGDAAGVTAEMVSEGSTGTLRLANLRPLPSGEVLQAWVRRDGKIESTKTLFLPDRDGTATAVIDDMGGVDTVMVTAEPRGGSDSPTSEPLVSMAIPN